MEEQLNTVLLERMLNSLSGLGEGSGCLHPQLDNSIYLQRIRDVLLGVEPGKYGALDNAVYLQQIRDAILGVESSRYGGLGEVLYLQQIRDAFRGITSKHDGALDKNIYLKDIIDSHCMYFSRVMITRKDRLILGLRLDELAGLVATDYSLKSSNCVYPATGIAYNQLGIGDQRTSVDFSGNNSYVNIPTDVNTFDQDWDGNSYSVVCWAKVDNPNRWLDNTTYRWIGHIRATATYYTAMGKSQVSNQLEWRRRTGGAITSKTYTFATPPSGWFSIGITFSLSGPLMSCYLWSEETGFVEVGTSNSVNLTNWGANPPVGGVSLFYAGSLTLQEWIGAGAHCYVWNVDLSKDEMQRAMTLP